MPAWINRATSLKILSQKLLVEASKEENDLEAGVDSLDAQVDKHLVNYETEAKTSKNEGLDFRMMTRRFLIEAEDDEEKKDDDKSAKIAAKKLSLDDIDMKSYVSSVMRLVENYDNLLEVRNTILRRAKNHIVKNYEKSAGQSFDDTLQEEHGIEIGKSKYEEEDEFAAPPAGRAGPAGGGGA